MALGFETYEDDRDFKQAGITGEVTKYPTSKIQYPCYMITSAMPKYKAEVLQTMVKSINVENYDADFLATRVYIYIALQNKIYKIGQIYAKQVKSFISLCEGEQLIGYLDADTKLDGMYLYTLAN